MTEPKIKIKYYLFLISNIYKSIKIEVFKFKQNLESKTYLYSINRNK